MVGLTVRLSPITSPGAFPFGFPVLSLLVLRQRPSTARAATRGASAATNLNDVAVLDILGDDDGGPDERRLTDDCRSSETDEDDGDSDDENAEVLAIAGPVAAAREESRKRQSPYLPADSLSAGNVGATTKQAKNTKARSAATLGVTTNGRKVATAPPSDDEECVEVVPGVSASGKQSQSASVLAAAGNVVTRGKGRKAGAGGKGRKAGAGGKGGKADNTAPESNPSKRKKTKAQDAADLDKAISKAKLKDTPQRRKKLKELAGLRSAEARQETEDAYAASRDRMAARANGPRGGPDSEVEAGARAAPASANGAAARTAERGATAGDVGAARAAVKRNAIASNAIQVT